MATPKPIPLDSLAGRKPIPASESPPTPEACVNALKALPGGLELLENFYDGAILQIDNERSPPATALLIEMGGMRYYPTPPGFFELLTKLGLVCRVKVERFRPTAAGRHVLIEAHTAFLKQSGKI